MKSVLSVTAAAVFFPLVLGGCVVVDSQGHIARDEKRFTITGNPEVKLTTFDGAIEIRSATDARTVLVEVEKRGPTQEAIDELKIETTQDGNRIAVEVKRPQRDVMAFGFGHISPTAKLIVTMPRDGNVIARSGDGSIRIDGIRGKLDLRTGDGSIRASEIGGQLSMATGDGSVTIDNADGDLDVDTGDGSVSIAGKLGIVKVHTGDGAITFRAEQGTTMKDDWSMVTGDGSVALYLPSDFAAQLDAHTGDGAIRNDLKIDSKSGVDERRTLRGTLGAGGRTLRIRTGDGGIRLKVS
jgi:DUF4097 and DUF4098 domain-containing protein YvlB